MSMEVKKFIKAFDGKVKVVAEKYEGDCSSNCAEGFGYKGKDLLTVMVKIDSTHSYGSSEDDFEDKDAENPDVDDVIWDIISKNADGCDHILTMETGGVTLTIGEEDTDVDEYEDCDEDGMEYE